MALWAMDADLPPISRRSPHSAFALSAWAMLLVVLLSAVPAGAQTGIRLVGSAFDPTTLSVALSPKQPKAKATARSAERRGLPDRGSGDHSAHLARAAPIVWDVAPQPAEARPSVAPSPPATPRALARAHRPRAPPAS